MLRGNRAAELRKKSLTKTGANSSSSREVRLTFCISVGYFSDQARSPVSSRKKSDLDGVRNATKVIKGCDSKLVEAIVNEVVPKGATGVRFSDISGQEKAKAALQEMVVLPRFDNDFTSHHLP